MHQATQPRFVLTRRLAVDCCCCCCCCCCC
ncbi:MAG: Rv2334A family Cys-rich leader peptide [Mycobacterium sp.]